MKKTSIFATVTILVALVGVAFWCRIVPPAPPGVSVHYLGMTNHGGQHRYSVFAVSNWIADRFPYTLRTEMLSADGWVASDQEAFSALPTKKAGLGYSFAWVEPAAGATNSWRLVIATMQPPTGVRKVVQVLQSSGDRLIHPLRRSSAGLIEHRIYGPVMQAAIIL